MNDENADHLKEYTNESLDGQVALIVSILEDTVPTKIIVETLLETQGDIDAALNRLLSTDSSSISDTKRKRKGELETSLSNPNSNSKQRRKMESTLEDFVGLQKTTLPSKLSNEEFTPLSPKSTHHQSANLLAGRSAFDILLKASPSKSITTPLRKQQQSKVLKLDSRNVSQHIPCALLHDIWDSSLADELLLELLKAAKDWGKLAVRINEKEMYSSHLTNLYVDSHQKQNPEQFTYAGAIVETHDFTPLMRQVARHISVHVNSAYKHYRSHRTPWEIKDDWIPTMAVANWYPGPNASVGAHSDKLTMIGTMPVIASYTLGATRTFRLRRIVPEDEKSNVFDILLPHNSLFIMFPPCQEQFKHEVPKISAHVNGPCSTLIPHPVCRESRINLTFRMARLEYIDATPKCHCGNLCILKPVSKAKETIGRYFYMCGGAADVIDPQSGKSKPYTCQFFQWLEKPILPNSSR